ncbi:MAG: hypothetical protein ACXADY_15305 [Candidatus Hodarchaeales archaeon]|jgi:hypothetical protein
MREERDKKLARKNKLTIFACIFIIIAFLFIIYRAMPKETVVFEKDISINLKTFLYIEHSSNFISFKAGQKFTIKITNYSTNEETTVNVILYNNVENIWTSSFSGNTELSGDVKEDSDYYKFSFSVYQNSNLPGPEVSFHVQILRRD